MAFNPDDFVPCLGAIGQALIDLDEDKAEADDFVGTLLVYSAEVIAAASDDEELPEFPELLKEGTKGKIQGSLRATLAIANAALTVARFQFSGHAAKVLKYATQAISQLLAKQSVPPAPADIQ